MTKPEAVPRIQDPVLGRRRDYVRGFEFAAGGVLFLLDVRLTMPRLGLDHVDVLPDLVGYILLMVSLQLLLALHRHAHPGQLTAMALLPLGFLQLLPEHVEVPALARTAATFAELALQLVLVWVLLGIVADLARHLAFLETARRVERRRVAFVGFFAIAGAVDLVVNTTEYESRALDPVILAGLVLVVMGFAVFFLVIASLLQARVLLGGKPLF